MMPKDQVTRPGLVWIRRPEVLTNGRNVQVGIVGCGCSCPINVCPDGKCN